MAFLRPFDMTELPIPPLYMQEMDPLTPMWAQDKSPLIPKWIYGCENS